MSDRLLHSQIVGDPGLEPGASRSQTARATNCANPRLRLPPVGYGGQARLNQYQSETSAICKIAVVV